MKKIFVFRFFIVILVIFTSSFIDFSLIKASFYNKGKNSSLNILNYAYSFTKLSHKNSASFDGYFDFSKSVDVNGNGTYDDAGKLVAPGTTLRYRIDWKFNKGNDPLNMPYIYDRIPEKTQYVGGSATNDMLSYSQNSGLSWINGEPPDGADSGTMLRWESKDQFWSTIADISYDKLIENADISKSGVQVSQTLDSFGRPCIAFADYVDYDNKKYDIMFVRWDGAKWVGANGLPYNPENGANAFVSNTPTESDGPSLVLDQNGYPCIAWGEKINSNVITSWEIFFVRWNGSDWVNAQGVAYNGTNANVSNTPSTSYGVSLAIDSNGQPAMAWYDYSGASLSFEISFVRWNGSSWVNSTGVVYNGTNAYVSNTLSSSEFPCMKLDKFDNPCISWSEGSFGGYDVMYVHWDGTQWLGANNLPYNPLTGANANVSRNSGYSSYPCLDLDSNDLPGLIWHDYTFGVAITDILCVKWDGTQWVGANGLAYDNTTGQNAIVARNARITGGVSSPLHLSAKITSIKIDKDDNIHVLWWGDIFGNKGLYYLKWSGSMWVGANESQFVFADGTNGYTNACSTSQYINYANAVSLDIDASGIPFLAYFTQTTEQYSISLIKYHPPSLPRAFYFSVRVENPFIDYSKSPITNQAEFSHALDQGNKIISNNVINSVARPLIEIKKTAQKFTYSSEDFISFKITAVNNGNFDAMAVTLIDSYPRELDYFSSNPQGIIGNGNLIFYLGTLRAGQRRIFEVKFKLSKSSRVGDKGLYVTNIAKATSVDSKILAEDSAVVLVVKETPIKNIQMNVSWQGLNTKTNTAKSGEEISAKVMPEGGSSPYEIVFDWGDGQKDKASEITSENFPTFKHTYNSQGEYNISITCLDQFGKQCNVIRKITVK